jgi:aminopeptidase N
MNDISTSVSNGFKTVTFATTPLMSTYLLAFVVGDLGVIEDRAPDASKTLVRVFAPKGLESQGKFAMDVCCRTLDFFATYFDIPYPIPKMDLVAIPDFAAGAMEVLFLFTILILELGLSYLQNSLLVVR